MEDKIVQATNAPVSLFDFGSNLDRAWKFASTLAESQIIPDTFKRNPASCLIAIDMANRMRRNPLEVMQSLYIVHGKPSFSSSFLISLINSCGYYEPLRFRLMGEGDGRTCEAWTIDKRVGEEIVGPLVSIQMAKAEGWYNKSGSKWQTMPEVMLRYRAAAFFSRAYCPDLTGGFHSEDEARDEQGSVSAAPVVTLEAELMAQPKALPETPKQPEIQQPKEQPKAEDAMANKDTPKPVTDTTKPVVPVTDGDLMLLNPAPVVKTEQLDFPFDIPDKEVKAEVTSVRMPGAVNGYKSPAEKLRLELWGLLAIGFTDKEAEEWCDRNFGKALNALKEGELKSAISKINAELDKRDK